MCCEAMINVYAKHCSHRQYMCAVWRFDVFIDDKKRIFWVSSAQDRPFEGVSRNFDREIGSALVDAGAQHGPGREAAGTAMCRFEVCGAAITTARASTRTSSQTLGRLRGWKWFAHPGLLLNLMGLNRVALSWGISRCRSRHTTGWRWPAMRPSVGCVWVVRW